MSAMVKASTIQARAVEATSQLRAILGVEDLKLLSTALAEAAVDEARRNSQFTDNVRTIYNELAVLKGRRSTSKVRHQDVELVPIKTIPGYRRDPSAPIDPYFLLEIYGAHQLRAALSGYSLVRLKEASATTEQKNPGTRPQNKSRKDSIIDYIVEHVAGPGY